MDLIGKIVTEEETAEALGFPNVTEMRRWETDMGHKVAELKSKLREVQSDADNFRWHGQRMMTVLQKIESFLKNDEPFDKNKVILAIQVVCGTGVDWDHVLEDWFDKNV